MITTLDQVQSLFLKQSDKEKDSIFKRHYLMVDSSINEIDLHKLKEKNIKLPKSYLKILLRYKVNGISIEDISLSPYSWKNNNIIEDLFEAYEDSFYPREFMDKHNMHQIGSYEADTLCVTNGTNYYKEGEILLILYNGDIYNPQDNQIKKLAKNFEQFLIMLGNLNQICTETSENYFNKEESRQEFFDRLKILNVDFEYYDGWDYVLNVSFGLDD